ncbi:MAG TPA: biotin/lipoyl-containing protein, partial [Dongiaceae bacterium]
MPIEILMPALSPTMTEGKLAKWLKAVGDNVRSGDVIAEIETDKATMEVEAADEGKLSEILIPAGTENVKVNTPIALLAGEGEKPSATRAPAAAAAPVSAPAPTPAAAKPAAAPPAPKAAAEPTFAGPTATM